MKELPSPPVRADLQGETSGHHHQALRYGITGGVPGAQAGGAERRGLGGQRWGTKRMGGCGCCSGGSGSAAGEDTKEVRATPVLTGKQLPDRAAFLANPSSKQEVQAAGGLGSKSEAVSAKSAKGCGAKGPSDGQWEPLKG